MSRAMNQMFDLIKSELNTSKLVKKPILVRGKDGKVFTRMQWVSPGEIPGVDKNKKVDKKEENKYTSPKLDTKEFTNNAEIEGFKDELAQFMASKNKQDEEIDVKLKAIKDKQDPIAGEGTITTKEFENKYSSSDPFIDYIAKEAFSFKSLGTPIADLRALEYKLKWRDIESLVNSKIQKTKDEHARDMQEQTMYEGNVMHMFKVGAHPEFARLSVDKVLGKELANQFREDIKNANLTINFNETHADYVAKEGYKASNPEHYIKSNFNSVRSERLLGEYNKILNSDEYDSEEDRIYALRSISDPKAGELYDRADAEYKALGMKLEDAKPVYIAFNPIDNPMGANSHYGPRHLKIDESVLDSCTLTMDDSFADERAMAKIWSIDHLKDIFILKAIEEYPGDISKIPDGGLPWYARAARDIPLELQYHKPHLEPSLFTLNDPVADAKKERQQAIQEFMNSKSDFIPEYMKDMMKEEGIDYKELGLIDKKGKDEMDAMMFDPDIDLDDLGDLEFDIDDDIDSFLEDYKEGDNEDVLEEDMEKKEEPKKFSWDDV